MPSRRRSRYRKGDPSRLHQRHDRLRGVESADETACEEPHADAQSKRQSAGAQSPRSDSTPPERRGATFRVDAPRCELDRTRRGRPLRALAERVVRRAPATDARLVVRFFEHLVFRRIPSRVEIVRIEFVKILAGNQSQSSRSVTFARTLRPPAMRASPLDVAHHGTSSAAADMTNQGRDEKMRLALVPPKPKEFVMAYRIGIGAGRWTIRFKALSASGVVRFMVGGAT